MIKTIFVILLIIVIPLAGFLWLMGFFTTLKIGVEKSEHYWLVYEKIKGDYMQAGDSCGKVYRWLYASNIETTRGFGIYYDNPKTTAKSELRSVAGCILQEKDLDKIEQIRQEFFVKEIFPLSCIKTSFPYKNKLSILLGVLRAYPEIEKFAQKHDYTKLYSASIEIYDEPNETITYLVPIEQNADLLDKFYNITEK